MHFSCRSFIGKPTGSGWSQYWENEPDDPSLIISKGHLFGLINILADSEEGDLSTVGHDIIFELNQNYFAVDSGFNIADSLKKSILLVVNNPLYKLGKLEFILAVVLKNQLFLASYGSGKVIVSRGNRIGVILSNDIEEVKTIEGPLAFEDKVLLLTDSFYQQFSWKKIKTVLSYEKIENIEENFLSILYSLKDQSEIAAALIQPHSDEGDEAFPDDNEPSVAKEDIYKTEEPLFIPSAANEPPPNPLPIIHATKDFFSNLKNSQNKSVYVAHHDTKQINRRKKINIVIAFILIAGLSVSSYLGYTKNRQSNIEKQYQSLKTELDSKFENIVAVKNLNINSARDLAKESENIIQKMGDLKVHQDEVSRYKSQIQQILTQTGASDNFSPDLFYDTSISFKNAKYQKMLLKDNKLYLLDSSNGRIDVIKTEQKSGEKFFSSDKLKSTLYLTANNNNIFAASINNVYLVNSNNIESKIDLNSKNVKLSEISFWNGAAYVLDQTNNTIWKITPNSTGFGSPQVWLKNNQKLEPGAVSFAINGKIWVLYKDGRVVPYTSGNKDNFSPNQQSQFTETSNLDVTIDSGLLAFSDNNIVYLYKQTGELKAKYNLDKLVVADLVMNDEDNALYILCTDQKIYKISL
jgi:hypothetical protein